MLCVLLPTNQACLATHPVNCYRFQKEECLFYFPFFLIGNQIHFADITLRIIGYQQIEAIC